MAALVARLPCPSVVPQILSLGSLSRLAKVPFRTAFFGKKSSEKLQEQERKFDPEFDGPLARNRTASLKKRTSVRTVQGYKPPPDLEQRMKGISVEVCGEAADWRKVALVDRLLKFKFLTKCIEEFDHDIPNCELNFISDTSQALAYFRKEVRDTSSYEDLSKLDLPRNLHIQMEPVRFHPETDTMFGGITAFPDQPTVVSSIKYKYKYKGNDGTHRNK